MIRNWGEHARTGWIDPTLQVSFGGNYGPIMVHESVPTTTYYAFGSHPHRVFSIIYLLTGFFHGGNTGSNPVGDANFINHLQNPSRILYVR
jgi:hypothetical protein